MNDESLDEKSQTFIASQTAWFLTKNIYEHIRNNISTNIALAYTTIQQQFHAHLEPIVQGALKIPKPIHGFSHTLQPSSTHHAPSLSTTTNTQPPQFSEPITCLTWNCRHLNTVLKDNPSLLIFVQETKIPKEKLPSHKTIYNNVLDAITCWKRPYIQYAPIKGGFITIILKTIAFSGNIHKLKPPT